MIKPQLLMPCACLRSLGFLEIDYREHDICDAVDNTCDWLFRTTKFERWRARTDLATYNGVLCIKGKPGAGKSTLMKHTLAHCKQAFPDHLIVAYFFNARGGALEKTPLGMLRSMVYQLIKQDDKLFEHFLTKFRDKQHLSQEGRWEWRLQELKSFLASAVKHERSRPLLLLVDALDECNGVDMQDVVEFLESLSSNATRCGTTLRICLSRRHHPPLRIQRCLELIVENNKDHVEDIAIYVQAKLAKRDDKIEAEIKRKADGIFMWVVLVVSLLNKAYLKGDVDEMRDTLEQVPEELEEVFRVLLSKDDEDMAETVLMLQWVLFSQRPLELAELFFAVKAGTAPTSTDRWSRSSATDDKIMRRRINYLSRGLVEVRSGLATTVQFIHLSVGDFLLRNKRLQTLDPSLEPDPVCASHYQLWALCRLCIEQISTVRTEEAYEQLCDRYPFLGYAACYVLEHTKKVLGEGPSASEDNNDEIGKWLREENGWFEWWKAFLNATNLDWRLRYLIGNIDAGLLYILSIHGHGGLVRSVLGDKGAEVNAQGGEHGNALQAASYKGHREIVELLLEKGAEVNAQGGYCGNALQAASYWGRQEIMELLLEKGAKVNAQGGYCGNALQAASHQGDREIVKLLLEKGAEVNAQGGEYGNALQAASYKGRQEIVKLLLEKGAEVNAQGGYYGNALQATSYKGRQEIVKLLLEKGAEVNAQGGYYGNALQATSYKGRQEIVKLLLEKGAEVNAQGGYYGNALQATSYKGRQEIVKLLLEKGAEVNAQGGYYGNALQAASHQGDREIVKLLLEKGAEVNAQGGYYGNALQATSYKGRQEIVKLLLEKGAEVNAQGGYYGNALQATSYEGRQEIVKLLLEKGAEVNAQGGYYGNALQAASYKGRQEIVKLLLEKGAEVNAQGGEYGNALQAASRAGHKNIVAILSTARSIVNTKDLHEDNPPKAFLTEPSQDAIRTASKEQLIFKAIWRHVIPRTAFLWPGLVFAIIGGLILRLIRGRRIVFIVSKAIQHISIRRRYNR
ncbi:ankyrin repeat-containing domain protein [Phaeosphaeriaceae sp. PMI808]|nr:ankyrin repeat-containing domain protein [Phaeosphaeriaceae sp. PMI808]